MQREQRRHHRASPDKPRHPAQHQQHQQRIGHVKQHVDQVMRARVQPKQLAIQHVRNPRDRVPVGVLAVQVEESPRQPRPG